MLYDECKACYDQCETGAACDRPCQDCGACDRSALSDHRGLHDVKCIESTIRDAAMRDYACLLPADCTTQRAAHGIPSTHESSLQAIARSFGWVTTSTDVVDAITSSGFKALNNEPLAVAILKPTYRNCARNRRHHYSEPPTSAPDAYSEC